ncbi:zinc finger HIT domain-containing protein 1-like isoform X2 [Halichondria panicea]|uniref:zinc finger HIT domain-containing protein 1-like isoform X2 n=1 Tax=Halichondria panicea TaxID=6063 RepID=UPI00312B919C
MSEKKAKEVRTRSATAPQKRVLDDATRKRRHQRQLEALEKDNFHDDPHAIYAHLTSKTKLPTFADGSEKKKKKTRTNADHFKQRFRKTFQSLLEEVPPETYQKPSFVTAAAPPSKLPPRHFCAVCGFFSKYRCVTCGARYCSVRCLGTHKDTRCLKWTA